MYGSCQQYLNTSINGATNASELTKFLSQTVVVFITIFLLNEMGYRSCNSTYIFTYAIICEAKSQVCIVIRLVDDSLWYVT